MANDMDILFKTEDKPEIEKITKLIKTMDDNEQNNMLIFMQGVKFNEISKSKSIDKIVSSKL